MWAWYIFGIIAAIVVILLYCYAKWLTGYFKRRGIKNLPYSCPLFGNMVRVLTRKDHFLDLFHRLYTTFPDQKYVGFMLFTKPFVLINNLELVKRMNVDDFDHFSNHFGSISDKIDPLFGRTLISLKDDKWRSMRATLSPAFTKSKMKNMFPLIKSVSQQFNDYHLGQMNGSKNRDFLSVEIQDAFRRCVTDMIATVGFGIEINSLTEPNNEFFTKAKPATTISVMQFIKVMLNLLLPSRLSEVLGLYLISKNIGDYFRNLIWTNIKNREKNNFSRPDMVQILMDIKNGSIIQDINNDKNEEFSVHIESNIGKQQPTKDWTEDDLTAQMMSFFVAGLDNSISVLTFMTHELAINPDIQKRLQNEIDELNNKGSNLDYDDLVKMKYLDMVVAETLRKWPPLVATDRRCTKQYNLPPVSEASETGHMLEVGDAVFITIYGFHRDSKFYPNPEKFDPERFSNENKKNINPSAFMPFGVGPRTCISSRLAIMIIKTIMFQLLATFDLVVIDKTQNPIKLSRDIHFLQADKGLWMGLKLRHI